MRVLEDRPYEIEVADGPPVWIHDFGMVAGDLGELRIEGLREVFQEAFRRVWRSQAENDDFNRLVLHARFNWREVALLRAYAKYMKQAGVAFSQAYMEQTLAGYPAVARKLVAEGVDGLILPPPMCDSRPLVDFLGRNSTACVVIASGVPSKAVSSVGIDDFAAAHAMTTHLLDQGHSRIGFIAGNPDQTASARRQQGYEQALRERGMKPAPELVQPGLFTYRSGLDAAERLLRLKLPPTAIFASNDDMAAATVAVAHSQGLAVPGDLTVCGFDDTLMATTIWPELTTVRQPIDGLSRAALRMLVDAVKARRAGKAMPVRQERLDFTLVRRHSDAAPRRRPPAAQLRQA